MTGRTMRADRAVSSPSPMPELYTKDILMLAAGLPHGDYIEGADASASRRSPVCGSEIAADVKLDADGRLSALAFRARACAMGQASASLLRRLGAGKTAAEIQATRVALADALAGRAGFDRCWPELSVFEAARAHSARHAAILLPYDAVLAALADLG